jgi:hypothetical protein
MPRRLALIAPLSLLAACAPPAAEAWPTQWLPRDGFRKLHAVPPGGEAAAD